MFMWAPWDVGKALSVCVLKAGSSKLSLYKKILEIYGDLSWGAFKGDGVYLVSSRAEMCYTKSLSFRVKEKPFVNRVVGKGA